MQIGAKPPIVVDPEIEPLMKGDMLKVCDLMLDRIVALAELHGVVVVRIMIQPRLCVDDDCDEVEEEEVVFKIDVDADDDPAFRYWEAISDSVSDSEVPERVREMMDSAWVQVYW